jgi:hypothetical protein
MKTTTKGTDAAGKPTLTVVTATFDGKDNPVTGNPQEKLFKRARTLSPRTARLGPSPLRVSMRKAGKSTTSSSMKTSSDQLGSVFEYPVAE